MLTCHKLYVHANTYKDVQIYALSYCCRFEVKVRRIYLVLTEVLVLPCCPPRAPPTQRFVLPWSYRWRNTRLMTHRRRVHTILSMTVRSMRCGHSCRPHPRQWRHLNHECSLLLHIIRWMQR